MIIFPDIEIQNGQSVNRIRGKENKPEVYDIAPLDAAEKFAAAGAEWLHVIDIDAGLQGGHRNSDLICGIIDSVDIPVQVGGGIRTYLDVEWWLDKGAARVVLGTAAVVDRHMIMDVCGRFPGQIVISITGKDGYAMIDGWRTRTSFTTLEQILREQRRRRHHIHRPRSLRGRPGGRPGVHHRDRYAARDTADLHRHR